MKLSTRRAFLFDMDGTIVDNCAFHVSAWKLFSKSLGNELSKEDILNWMGATNRFYQEQILKRPVSDEEYERFAHEKETIYQQLYAPHIRLVDGLRDFLNVAHSKKIKCAVASGAPRENIDFVFKALNLFNDFPVIIDSSCYKNGKPAPDSYLEAAKRLDVKPSDCIVFEDAISGIEAAKRAGMFCIAITNTMPREALSKADLIISSFKELNDLF